ncbi:MAG: hypothetical protein N0A16_12445 [Blastocatellia bacterium]|nr:hypothetical protein [Blastocatellia bacterium]
MPILVGLIVGLLLWPLGQSERRIEQIRDLLGKSDLVVVATAEAYHPVIDLLKYRRERERSPVLDPARAERYMLGVVYRMNVREVIYRNPKRIEDAPLVGQAGDVLMIYVPGRLADPREFGKATFLPGAEYLVFLRKAELKREDFRSAVEQVSGAPASEWRSFPDPRVIYYTPVRDPFAALLMEGAWKDFLQQTRAVANAPRS